jgi:WD40 repeat protein
VCASGGTDGNIVLVHADSTKVLSVVPVPAFHARELDDAQQDTQEQLDGGKSIEAMAFSPDGSVLCVGYVNGAILRLSFLKTRKTTFLGTVNFLQSSNLSLRGSSFVEHAAIVKIIAFKQHQIAVSATDGIVRLDRTCVQIAPTKMFVCRIYDTRTCAIVNELCGHTGEIFDVAHIQMDTGDFVLSASADTTCKVFQVDTEE